MTAGWITPCSGCLMRTCVCDAPLIDEPESISKPRPLTDADRKAYADWCAQVDAMRAEAQAQLAQRINSGLEPKAERKAA